MSDMVRVQVIDANDAVEKAKQQMAAMPDDFQKAIRAAIRRAYRSGKALGAKEVGRVFAIKASTFKAVTKISGRVESMGGSTVLNVKFAGHKIPLITFATGVNKKGQFRVRVRKDSGSKLFYHAFPMLDKKGQMGLYNRVGRSRLPIEQLFGPSTADMMSAERNGSIRKEMGDRIMETFNKRLEHEVTARLNGWVSGGGKG